MNGVICDERRQSLRAVANMFLAEVEDKILNVDGIAPKGTHKGKPLRLYLCIGMPLWHRLEIIK